MNTLSSYNPSALGYTLRLNDKESLLYEEDPRFANKEDDQAKKIANEQVKKEQEKKAKGVTELTVEEKQVVAELQARDMEVRAHEMAHKSAGANTGAASYTYQKGPDGRMYAIGGEVSISYKSGSTPQETIQNAQAVIAAALAPSDPSPQDLAVASSARMMIMKAQQQKARELQEEMQGKESYKKASESSLEQENPKNLLDIPA